MFTRPIRILLSQDLNRLADLNGEEQVKHLMQELIVFRFVMGVATLEGSPLSISPLIPGPELIITG